MIRGVIFDLGNTLIHQESDKETSLDRLDLRPLPGAEACLRHLASRFRLAILSNTETTTSEQLANALGNLRWDALAVRPFTSVSLGVRKPDSRAFLAVARALGLKPRELVMIGNDPVEDIQGAAAVGFATVLLSAGPLSRPAAVVSDLSEISCQMLARLAAASSTADAGPHPSGHGNTDRELGVPALNRAIAMEEQQEWRRIGALWLDCAQMEDLPAEAETFPASADYVDIESTTHNFPHVSRQRWTELSRLSRAGRAYRYAGYHFEGDGDRQSSYRLYRVSGRRFEEDLQFDEASRSYFLALLSHVRRFGQLDDGLLGDLERTTQLLVDYDERRFLTRMIIYYRKLASLLAAGGNHPGFLTMRRKRLNAERRLLRRPRTALRYIVVSAWSLLTDYGQSTSRWIAILTTATLLVFPAVYKLSHCFLEGVSTSDAVLYSLARFSGQSLTSLARLTRLGEVVGVVQGGFTLLWLGTLVSILASRTRE